MSMEIKIPKEIRTYSESVFWGLSVRQLVCSITGLGGAVAAYFGLGKYLDQETLSWVCVLIAAPFMIAAFFSYHGMTLEKFLWAWFKSEFLRAGPRKFVAKNYYMEFEKMVVEESKTAKWPLFSKGFAKKKPKPDVENMESELEQRPEDPIQTMEVSLPQEPVIDDTTEVFKETEQPDLSNVIVADPQETVNTLSDALALAQSILEQQKKKGNRNE